MAKASDRERQLYLEKTAPYREAIESILKSENEKLEAIDLDPDGAAFKRIALAEDMLDLVSHCIVMNGVSLVMLKTKNEDALNEARKYIYKSVIYLEQVVGTLVDAAFSEYKDKAAVIESMDPIQRYDLVRKAGLAIQLLKEAYGDNSKWRWSFVELEGRYAAATKNILDMKNIVVYMDPRSAFYAPAMGHLRILTRLLSHAADRYRERYELSTSNADDFRLAIEFLRVLRRFYIILDNKDEAEDMKKKIDSWSAKLESDLKKRGEASRNAAKKHP
ncbi:MAG: hypothetical protein LBU18_00410 [Treponema sp.]|jgi:hypothetical protein|nr:hypothetical protein [Treponema sp.]